MKKLFTIGHSNRTFEEFLELLHVFEIKCLVDVRTIPKSRHVPWTNSNSLNKTLPREHINYHHLPELGGLRHTKADSPNTGWKNKSFRGYADYMQTKEFFAGLKILNEWVEHHPFTAVMCAEAVPWRCHRSLIADAEIIRDCQVIHIMQKNTVKEHTLTSFAIVDRSKRPMQIIYPA